MIAISLFYQINFINQFLSINFINFILSISLYQFHFINFILSNFILSISFYQLFYLKNFILLISFYQFYLKNSYQANNFHSLLLIMIPHFHLVWILRSTIKKNSIARTIPVTGKQQLNFHVEEVSFECIIGHS